MKFYGKFIKRPLDFLATLPIIAVALPVGVLTAVAIMVCRRESKVFFSQRRPGYKGRIFTIYKFRTMNDSRDSSGNLLPDAERLDSVGKFIRSLSLDELPQFWNVLKGDMSLIGPRPLLEQYLPLYSAEQMRRHDVLPGITGLAQINGRNSISWQDKFKLDVEYVDNQSALLDFRIFCGTFMKVFRREGISQEGEATMDFFRGNA